LRETRYRTFSHGCCRYPKIWLRLQRVGAVAIKNSVYVMPRSDQSLEDFQWTVREITEGGGDAWICEAGFVEGISNDQVEALFSRGARRRLRWNQRRGEGTRQKVSRGRKAQRRTRR